MMRKLPAALLAVGVAAATIVVASPAAHAESECPAVEKPVEPSEVKKESLLAQEMLGVKRVWKTTKGEGVKVAVIDSGVEKSQPLLEGRVTGGKAWVQPDEDKKPSGGDDATEDCDGHGTEVAGIIAAKEDKESGFYGIAPKAEIQPYRIAFARPTEDPQATEDDSEEGEDPTVTSDDFADAIRTAAEDGAKVINLSVKYDEDYESIANAVKFAVEEKDVVVVAAAGNGGETDKQTYPANYPGVIGVGAVDHTASKIPESQSGPWVDIVAPGLQTLAAPLPDGRYDTAFGGTSGATAFVSGTAALLRAQHEDWSADKVSKQITGTASPTPGGKGMYGDENVEGETGVSPDYGHGLINPYAAVNNKVTANGDGSDQEQMDEPKADPALRERNSDFASMRSWALWITLGGLAVFVLALAGVGALRRGKKSTWGVKRVDRSAQIEHFDDGDPIPLFQGIKGLKE